MTPELRRNLLLGLGSTALSFLILVGLYELYARYRHQEWMKQYKESEQWYGGLTIPSTNPILMWEYRANGIFHDDEGGYTIRTDRHGFRNSNAIDPGSAADGMRVAFIGDSVTLGLYVESEETLVARFEEVAGRCSAGRKVAALNFGIDGYNTVQIAELLRTKVLHYAPDVVVYVLCLNDFDFEDASGSKVQYFTKPKSFFLRKTQHMYRRLLNLEYHTYHLDRNREVAESDALSGELPMGLSTHSVQG